MKTKLRRTLGLVMAIMMVVTMFAGLTVNAGAVVEIPEGPYKLTIHKYDVPDDSTPGGTLDGTGTVGIGENKLTGTTADAPTGYDGLNGVEFTLYSVQYIEKKENTEEPGSYTYKWVAADIDSPTPAASMTKYTGETEFPADVATEYENYFRLVQVGTPQTTAEIAYTDSNGNSVAATDGTAIFTVSTPGLYYVEETTPAKPSKITKTSTPFYVYLPMTQQKTFGDDTALDSWNSNVHVYPKNYTVLADAELIKYTDKITVEKYNSLTSEEKANYSVLESTETVITAAAWGELSEEDKALYAVDEYEEDTITPKTYKTTTATSYAKLLDTAKFDLEYLDVANPITKDAYDALPEGTDEEKEAKAKYEVYEKEDDGTTPKTYVKWIAAKYYNSTGTLTSVVNPLLTSGGKIKVEDLPVGKYRWVEKEPPAGYGLDSVPREFEITNADNGKIFTTLFENKSTPTISKKVNDKDEDTVGANDATKWQIYPTIPADIATYKDYTVYDAVDARLIPKTDSVVVTVSNDGFVTKNTTELIAETDYTIKWEEMTNDEYNALTGTSRTWSAESTSRITRDIADTDPVETEDVDVRKVLIVTFKQTGRAKLANWGALEVSFTTQIDMSKASTNTWIENDAVIEFTNASDQSGSSNVDPDEPENPDLPRVKTFEMKISKVDGDDNSKTIDGVEFKLYKGSSTDPIAVYAKLDSKKEVIAGTYYTYISPEKIYDADNNPTGEYKAAGDTLVTANGGALSIKGLDDATYSLKETKAKEGYQLLSNDVEIVIGTTGQTTITTGDTLQVKNYAIPDLPLTGGMGTLLFTVLGAAIIAFAGFMYLRSRKSKKSEA